MKSLLKQIVFLTLLFSLTQIAIASDWNAWLQSGSTAGNGGAGIAASTDDVSTAYYNPAAAVYFSGQTAGFSLLSRTYSQLFKGTVSANPSVTGLNTNATQAQGGQYTPLPSIMYIASISPKWAFALNISTPFRSWSRYPSSKPTQYSLIEQNLNDVDVGPAIAYQLTKNLSFAAGGDWWYIREYYRHTETQTSTTNNSDSKTTLGGYGVSWRVGMLWKATQSTTFGLSYRSHVRAHLTGDSELSGATVSKTRTKLKTTLPAMLIASAQQKINKQWTLLGTIVETSWSDINNLQIDRMATTSGPKNVTLLRGLKNNWRFILGANYAWTNALTLTGGLGYLTSAVKNSDRNLNFPSNNQTFGSIGFGYQLDPTIMLRGGYTHYFTQSMRIASTETFGSQQFTNNGRYYGNSDVIGLELDWKME